LEEPTAGSSVLHAKWSPRARSVVRIAAAVLLVQDGGQTHVGVPAGPEVATVSFAAGEGSWSIDHWWERHDT
jgi:hypothetical protein